MSTVFFRGLSPYRTDRRERSCATQDYIAVPRSDGLLGQYLREQI
jgi:hypothetical protein